MINQFFGALVLHTSQFQSGFPSDYSASNLDSQLCLEVLPTPIKCPDLKHKRKSKFVPEGNVLKKTRKNAKT